MCQQSSLRMDPKETAFMRFKAEGPRGRNEPPAPHEARLLASDFQNGLCCLLGQIYLLTTATQALPQTPHSWVRNCKRFSAGRATA